MIIMSKCGFCKKNISIDDFIDEQGKPITQDGKTVHWKSILAMFSCPHCDSVLGMGFFEQF